MTVRIRGIYATALTALFEDDLGVVQASSAIDDRFPDADFPAEPAAAAIETSQARQGVGVTGDPEVVDGVVSALAGVGRDAFTWADPVPGSAIFAGEVTETLGRGAIVDLGGPAGVVGGIDRPVAARAPEGFLPFDATGDRIEEGDRLLVQVHEASAPWTGGRPELDATVRVQGGLLALERGANPTSAATGGPSLADVLPTEPREGWAARWRDESEDADLDALGDALEEANERAATIDDALDDALDDTLDDTSEPGAREPGPIHAGEATAWIWFGRESRFELDERRRGVTPTMPGHHRIKAGANAASAAVDFVEAVCPDAGSSGEETAENTVPFGVLSEQFGPREGDRVDVGHVKPDGRRIDLGPATVTEVDPEGAVTLEREMSPGGTYDGLGIEHRAGDVATTSITEGRWWYPTVYRSADGEVRGTYVNVCTPVEVFPGEVRYVDLHVDVVKHGDGTVERVDDDELDAAEEAGEIPPALAEKARDVASAVERAL